MMSIRRPPRASDLHSEYKDILRAFYEGFVVSIRNFMSSGDLTVSVHDESHIYIQMDENTDLFPLESTITES